MKLLNSIITVCFVVVFAGLFYFNKSDPADMMKEVFESPTAAAPAPAPDVSESKQGEKRMPVPMAPPTAMIQEDSLTKNEYIRGAVGAVIGWLVKSVCELLLGMVKKLFLLKA